MSKLGSIAQRFPEREIELYRLSAKSPDFRAVCEDFADARAAFEYWSGMGPKADERAAEYRALVEELAAAVLAALDRERGGEADR